MHQKIGFLLVVGFAVGLAACGGRVPVPPASSGSSDYAASALAAQGAAKGDAWGYVYGDPDGKPLKGVQVRLEPWDKGCVKIDAHQAKCPGYLPWKTLTNAQGRFDLRGVPAGEYLLVVGTDSPSDLTNPTVHDHVTLTGGTQHLLAPTLPAIPCVDQAELGEHYCVALASPDVTPFPRPEVEKHGAYRLATLDKVHEVPCAVGFDAKRATRRLAPIVVDEWLTENTRETNAYDIEYSKTPHGYRGQFPQVTPFIAGGNLQVGGGNDCAEPFQWLTDDIWSDPRTLWFGGTYESFENGHQGRGFDEYPIDPRVTGIVYPNPVGPWL